jgi:hypothetical protein
VNIGEPDGQGGAENHSEQKAHEAISCKESLVKAAATLRQDRDPGAPLLCRRFDKGSADRQSLERVSGEGIIYKARGVEFMRFRPASAAAVLFAILLLDAVPASAQSFRTFRCQFTTGTTGRFDTDWDVKVASDRVDFSIEGIDAGQASAKIVSAFGMSNVLLFRGNNSLNFLELMPDGNQAFTTVFFSANRAGNREGSRDWFPAVHSRHMMIGNYPVVSHYRGYCQGN